FYKANVIDDKDCAWIYNEDFFYETTCFHPSFNYTKDDINLIKSNFKINFFDIYGSKDGVYFPPYNPLKKTAQSKSMNSNTTAHKSKIDKIVEYLINDSPNIVDDLDYISSNSITMFNSIIEHEDMVKEIVKRNISDFISDDVRKIGSIALPENHRM
ncbi:MAG: hypothetical protein KDC55_12535, partial [Ignavibacteriae bacterium]|nr:hypothetical protein [Ignavibacteriota bacterium]